jgi:drug/metabolite transporter (DMT)-like permease
MTRRGVVLFVLLGVAWGIPYLLIKIAVRHLDPVMLVFTRTALAAAILLPVAVVCSAGAFTVMAALVAEVGPVRATTVTYVNPAVALIAGAVVLGEQVTAWAVAGFALILAGCYLVAARGAVHPGRGAPGLPGRGRPETGPRLAAASGPGPASDSTP